MGLFSKKISEAEFWEYLERGDYKTLSELFDQGKKFKIDDMKGQAQQASWGRTNYATLYFLWKNGAPSPTPFIEQVFDRFKKGETFYPMIKEQEKKQAEELAMVKADLTNFNSVSQIPIDDIIFYKKEEEEEPVYILSVHIGYYLEDGYICKGNSLLFSIYYVQDIGEGEIIGDDNVISDEAFYLFSSHNPVQLISLKLSKLSDGKLKLRAELEFEFSFERNGEDQVLVLEKIVDEAL